MKQFQFHSVSLHFAKVVRLCVSLGLVPIVTLFLWFTTYSHAETADINDPIKGLERALEKLGIKELMKEREKIPIAEEKKAVEKNPNDANAHFILGMSYMLGRFNPKDKYLYGKKDAEQSAKSEFKEAIRLNPNDVRARLMHLYMMFIADEISQEGIKEIKEIVRIKPELARDLHPFLVMVNVMIGRHDEAIKQSKIGLTFWPDDKVYHYLLASFYLETKNYKEAIKEYEKVLTNDSDKFSLIERLGDAYFGIKNYKEAISSYSRAIEIGRAKDSLILVYKIYYKLAMAYRHQGNYEKAIINAIEANGLYDRYAAKKTDVAKVKKLLRELYEISGYKPEDFAKARLKHYIVSSSLDEARTQQVMGITPQNK